MSIFSRFTSKKPERVLLINIGSAAVVGAFVSYPNGKPLIEAAITKDIDILADLSLAQFERAMEKSLRELLTGLSSLHKEAPHRICIHLGSPWYASQVRVVKMSRPQPFVVTKTLMNDMLTRELKAFENEEMTVRHATADALRAVESKTMQVRLNGYPTEEPLGVSARELELSLFVSVSPERTLLGIEEIVTHEYPHRPISFSTFLASSFRTIGNLFPHQKDFLLVDIGGEVTDVSVVKDGALVQTVSFPRGRNFMLRRLSQGLSRSMAESVTLCNLYMENKIEDATKDLCAEILNKTKDDWLADFQKSLFSVSNELSIPSTIFLSVYGDVEAWFVQAIQKEEFHQYTLTEKEFKVIVLNAELCHDLLSFGEKVPRNPFIMIETLADYSAHAGRALPPLE